jgi:hypothetical protein
MALLYAHLEPQPRRNSSRSAEQCSPIPTWWQGRESSTPN